MAVLLKEACAWCGKAMIDTEIGDYWYHSEREPNFKCLCMLCARFYRFREPDGVVRGKSWLSGPEQLALL